jgi:hypothetical protein
VSAVCYNQRDAADTGTTQDVACGGASGGLAAQGRLRLCDGLSNRSMGTVDVGSSVCAIKNYINQPVRTARSRSELEAHSVIKRASGDLYCLQGTTDKTPEVYPCPNP